MHQQKVGSDNPLNLMGRDLVGRSLSRAILGEVWVACAAGDKGVEGADFVEVAAAATLRAVVGNECRSYPPTSPSCQSPDRDV